MAHFAKLNNGIVERVIVINNNVLLDNDGIEREEKGIKLCKDRYGQDSVWVQTSYNGNFRKNYAGLGYAYDSTRDAFIAPKPFDSWLLDEETCKWIPPVPCPEDDKLYDWNEKQKKWEETLPPT